MAAIVLVAWGVPASAGRRIAERPLAECLTKLGLSKNNYLGGLGEKVQFGSATDAAAQMGHPDHVVVTVTEPEAGANKWKPGYYFAAITPQEARKRLGLRG